MSEQPRVWNRRDPECPKSAIYVGRPTKFGNPFSHQPGTTAKFEVANRDEAVESYMRWVLAPEQEQLRKAIVEELRGQHLVCWCAPYACHADVLIAIANAGK